MSRLICSLHFFIVFFITIVSLPALADDINVESTIKAATVFNDRATLTRNAKVKIPAGSHNLVFTGLPIKLHTNSLRISGSAEASVIFGALTYKRETSEDFVVPRVKELNAKLEQIKNLIKVYEAEKQALVEANNFLRTWGKQANLSENKDAAKIHLNHEEWVTASDGLSAKILENLKGVINLDVTIHEANKKIKKMQKDLRQIRTAHKQSYTVIIPFESDKQSTLNVDLRYQISGVSWQPIYDARLDTKSKKLKLVQYGSVWQQTGEDWEDIELSLSTAQPSRGAVLPLIYSQWLSIYTPPPPTSSKDSAFSFEESDFEFEKPSNEVAQAAGGSAIPVPIETLDTRLEVPQIEEETEDPLHRWRLLQEERVQREMKSRPVVVQVNTHGYVGEYKITGPATVKSDGTKAKLMIGEFETDSELQVQIKPQISTDAYLVAKALLKGDVPILPGLVNLFRDGAYIGQSNIVNMLRPEEEAELSFGIDDNVTVKRNILKDESSEAGLITKDRVIEKLFITEIQNLHKQPIQISVLEIIPASKDERIRVEILKEKTTSGYESDINNVKGATRWMGTLEPQQKTAINLGWKVSWPKAENISGL